MNVTLQQAVDIHARVLRTRFGGRALRKAEERITHLTSFGDLAGAGVYESVRSALLRLQASEVR